MIRRPIANLTVDFAGDISATGVRTIERDYLTPIPLPTKGDLYMAMVRASVPYSFLNISQTKFKNNSWFLYSGNTDPALISPLYQGLSDCSIYNASMANIVIGKRCESQNLYVYSAQLDANVYPITIYGDTISGRFILALDRANLPAPAFTNRYLAVFTGDFFQNFGFTQPYYSIDTTLIDYKEFTAETASLLGEEVNSGILVLLEEPMIQSIHNNNSRSRVLGVVQITDQSVPSGALTFPKEGQQVSYCVMNKTDSFQKVKIRFVSSLDLNQDLIFTNGTTAITLEISTLDPVR